MSIKFYLYDWHRSEWSCYIGLHFIERRFEFLALPITCIIFEKSYINHTVTWECYCEGQIIIGWFFFCPNKCFLGPNFPLNSLFIHLWTKYIFLTSHNLINIVHIEILNLNFFSKTTQRPFNTNLHQIVICLFFLRGSTDSFHPARSTSSVFALHYGTTVRNHLFSGFLFFYLMYFSHVWTHFIHR